ncbi:hypothetical protein COB57_03070 [Candidatus Peregrinibacteria bacterium]|nr:MAG: hypothetical protein COB57_03070 [Candidatus Peregrinibacteria bacterium]
MIYHSHICGRQSYRLEKHDYSQNGLYFITICTKNRENIFGEIEAGTMMHTPGGEVAKRCVQAVSEHYPDVVISDSIVMPNHIHIILKIENGMLADNKKYHKFQKIIPRSIGVIIRGYKIGVTKWFRKNTEIYCVWQKNYYEHIITNTEEYFKISAYIKNNIKNWKEDCLYK